MRAIAALVCTALVAAPALAHAGDGVAILPWVAEDAQVVGVLDVKDARDGAMFDQGVQLTLDRATDMKDMMALVGLDLKKVDTVLVAGNYGSSGTIADINQNLMAVIEGGFTKKKMTKTLDGLAGVTTKKKRGIKYWITADAEAAIIGKRLVVTQPGLMPGVIDRSKKKAKGLLKSTKGAALRTALGYTDKRHDAWLVAIAPSNLASTMQAQLGALMVTYSLGVTLATNMTLEVKVQAGTPAQAADVVTKLTPQLVGLKKMAAKFGLATMASSIAVASDGDVVDVDATLTPAEVDTVLGLVAMINP